MTRKTIEALLLAFAIATAGCNEEEADTEEVAEVEAPPEVDEAPSFDPAALLSSIARHSWYCMYSGTTTYVRTE